MKLVVKFLNNILPKKPAVVAGFFISIEGRFRALTMKVLKDSYELRIQTNSVSKKK